MFWNDDGAKAGSAHGEGDLMSCGIDISAIPPGKKLQNITLLSGGEKALTAIALTFAMIRINVRRDRRAAGRG